jgi:hypothetical protein
VEAYDLYLRVRALAARRGIRGQVQSVDPLETVIAKDPSFAPAYSSLGAAYAITSSTGCSPAGEVILKKGRQLSNLKCHFGSANHKGKVVITVD